MNIMKLKRCAAFIIVFAMFTETVYGDTVGLDSDDINDIVLSAVSGFALQDDEVSSSAVEAEIVEDNEESETDETEESTDDTSVSGEIPNYVKNIAESEGKYTALSSADKSYLSRYYGVREDTMTACAEAGLRICESVNTALIMQKLHLSVSETKKMIENFGGCDEALSAAEEFKNIQYENALLFGEEITDGVGSVMKEGYYAAAALEVYSLAAAMEMKPADIILGNTETTEEYILSGSALTAVLDDETLSGSAVSSADIAAIISEVSKDSYISSLNIDEEVIIEYLAENSLSLSELYEIQDSIKSELGLNAVSTASDDSDTTEEDDSGKLTGAFTFDGDINDEVNLNTGSLMHTDYIASVPGVNGLDLNMFYFYDSGNKYYKSGTTGYKLTTAWELNYGYPVLKTTVDSSGNTPYRKLVFPNGTEYDVYKSKEEVYIKGYLYKDVVFEWDTDESYTDSAYKLVYEDGKVIYYNSMGVMLCIQDRFNNQITFSKTTADNITTTTITMPNGKIVTVEDVRAYTESNTSCKDTAINFPDGSSVSYKWKSLTSATPYIYAITEKTDRNGEVTKYTYETGCTYKTSAQNKYLEENLTKVEYPTGAAAVYEYETCEPIEEDLEDYFNYSRICEKSYTADGTAYNKTSYTYSDNNYLGFDTSDSTDYSITISKDTGFKETYTFDKYGLNTRYEGPVESRTLSYEETEQNNIKYYYTNPYQVKTTKGTYSYTEKYDYDGIGRLTAYWGPFSTSSYDDRYSDTEYKISCSYGDNNLLKQKSYKQNSDTTIYEKNTISSDGLTITNSAVYSNSTKLTDCNYTYDGFGNVLTQVKYAS
ncbi:MAG: hypothetical protein LUC97_03605, partial [Clostridiales bacterium]|nr:hypothetical protein [Clostridiales bacterium]